MNLRSFSPLQLALSASIAVHAVLLTVRFVDPQAFNRVFEDTPLEVILVNARTGEVPLQAQAIAQANWPGNLRELRSALQQALLQGDAKRIGAFDLGQYCMPLPLVSQSLLRPKAHDEKQLLLDALQSARWNASKAARSLGIGRATIHRKMKDYGISRPN